VVIRDAGRQLYEAAGDQAGATIAARVRAVVPAVVGSTTCRFANGDTGYLLPVSMDLVTNDSFFPRQLKETLGDLASRLGKEGQHLLHESIVDAGAGGVVMELLPALFQDMIGENWKLNKRFAGQSMASSREDISALPEPVVFDLTASPGARGAPRGRRANHGAAARSGPGDASNMHPESEMLLAEPLTGRCDTYADEVASTMPAIVPHGAAEGTPSPPAGVVGYF